jgi:hypothetical protein
VTTEPASTPAASEPATGGEPAGGSDASGGPGQVAETQSDPAAAGGASADATAGDSPSGLGDLVEGLTSAVGSDSEGSGLGVGFLLLLAGLLGAFAIVVIRRRRED